MTARPARPISLTVYLWLSSLLPWPLRLLLRRRVRRGKEEAGRLAEREGRGASAAMATPLIWAHGASVGETMALLSVLEALAAERGSVSAVVTTGTVTAARLAAARLPQGCVHRYAPLDCAPWVARFVDGWRPALALRIDSEIWPATLDTLAARGVPVLLLNGRLSEKSARRWAMLPGMARHLARGLKAIAAQDEASAARFRALGARPEAVQTLGALKAAVAPPVADPAALATLRETLAARPCWLAASTHPDEEATVLAAANAARAHLPGLLTIIAPRHPERGPAIADAARAMGLKVSRRSVGEAPDETSVYIADTLGEMGLWYRLAGVAFIGGSMGKLGGHNPYEPACLDVTLAAGPSRASFADAYAALDGADACRTIASADDLAAFLDWAFDADGARSAAANAAALRGAAALAADPRPLARTVALIGDTLDGLAP